MNITLKSKIRRKYALYVPLYHTSCILRSGKLIILPPSYPIKLYIPTSVIISPRSIGKYKFVQCHHYGLILRSQDEGTARDRSIGAYSEVSRGNYLEENRRRPVEINAQRQRREPGRLFIYMLAKVQCAWPSARDPSRET